MLQQQQWQWWYIYKVALVNKQRESKFQAYCFFFSFFKSIALFEVESHKTFSLGFCALGQVYPLLEQLHVIDAALFGILVPAAFL